MRKKINILKRVIAFFMCIAMVFGCFDGIGGSNFKVATIAKAAGVNVDQKLSELQRMFPTGSYFTASGATCGGQSQYHGGCDNCYLQNIINSRYPQYKGKMIESRWSCFAFATFAFYYIWGHDALNSVVDIGSDLRYAQKGDLIYFDYGKHFGIYLGDGTVYDANGSGIASQVKYGNRVYLPVTSIRRSNKASSTVITNETPQIFEEIGTPDQTYETETSFGRRARFKNPNRRKVLEIGMVLLDANQRELQTVKEPPNQLGVGSNIDTSYFWERTDIEFGRTLTPGTKYHYKFFIKTDEGTFFSQVYSVTTRGSAKPNVPTLSVDKTDVAVGDSINVNWQADSRAVNGYSVTIKSTSGTAYSKTVNVNSSNSTRVALQLPYAGTYSVTAYAKGSGGQNSAVATLNSKITAHKNVTVTFLQQTEKGTEILKRESVPYGHDATAPSAPSREGYTFQGWDKAYRNVKSDLTVAANYTINTYTITFVNEDGTVLKKENVKYLQSATPPDTPTTSKIGYVFAGWDSNDYKNVKKNATIKASFAWENNNLPIVVTASSCIYGNGGYTLTYSLTNYPTSNTNGRAIVSLKTSTGKLVATTESNAFTIAKGVTKSNQEIFIPYEGAATTAEIVIVDKFSTGIPISASKSVKATKEWSNWSTTVPNSSYISESRKEYRYRDKQTTTSSASSLSGWTKYNTTSVWSDWGNWSSWSRNNYSSSDSRQVETRSVTDSNAYRVNNYYYYRYYNSSVGQYMYTWSSGMGGTKYTMSQVGGNPAMKWYNNYNGYDCYRYSSGYRNFWDELWFSEGGYDVPATSHTEWRYRDRSRIYTYYYYRWGNYSNWSTSAVTANDNRQVETRTVYRYKANVEGEEDNTGTERTITGKVDPKFAGKQATLLVYKNEEAADYNNEYIGQSTIAADGGYSYTFTTREEVSAKTGDFTIDLALEGSTEAIYVDTVEAPKPTYTVKFVDWDGTELDSQIVTEGDTAILPENPERDGYQFKGWDTGITNIHDDLTITAVYEKKQYTVIWVDWERQNFDVATYFEGDELAVPSLPEVEGYEFDRWEDANGGVPATVSGNLVLTAQYKIKTYDVNFYDYEGDLVSNQTVEYGKSATAPELPEREGMVFSGWSNADYLNVREDMDVYPYYLYTETEEAPTISVKSGAYDKAFKVKINADSGAEIHYTTDGTSPDAYSPLYTEEITIDKNVVLQAIAISANKNPSAVQKAVYLISETEDLDGVLKIKKNSWDVERGDTNTLQYSLYRNDGKKEVSFYSLDDTIVSIEEDGKFTANGIGTTQIFAITSDLLYADYCTVNVTSNEVEVSSINVEKSLLRMTPNTSFEIDATVEPENATYKDIDWATSDSDIVSINEDGKMTAIDYGTAILRGYSHSGNCYIDCAVVVAEPYVEVEESAIALEKGKTFQENVTIYGDIDQNFTWVSSDESVATVTQDGLIKAIAAGKATISYVSDDEKYKDDVLVIVTDSTGLEILEDTDVVLSKESCEYTGKEVKPGITVRYKGTDLIEDTDYIVYYKNNVEVGVAKVCVIGIGKYTGTVTKSFSIVKQAVKPSESQGNGVADEKNNIKISTVKISSVKNSKSKQVLIKWKKCSNVDGYQIEYSTNKKFETKATKRVNVKNEKTISKTIKKLKKGKTYYVRIRAFKKTGDTVSYGSWSATKKVKIKK